MALKIGTRGSDLALKQTSLLIEAITATDCSMQIEIIKVKTSGDKKQLQGDKALFGDKKDWVYELELALLKGEIDVAVHSAKDMPGNTESGLSLIPVLSRAAANDVFIGALENGQRKKLADLKDGDRVGTSSLRRQAAIKYLFPKSIVVDHRGNVPTRIKKLDDSKDLSGIVIAAAGVERLKLLSAHEYEMIETDRMIPASNQGILVCQYRSDDEKIRNRLTHHSAKELMAVFVAERSCAHALGGDCNSAIGVLAAITGTDSIVITAAVYDPAGTTIIKDSVDGNINEAKILGVRLAERLMQAGAKQFLS